MSLKLEVKTKLTIRSARVKCIDIHSSEAWILCSLYSGEVTIWDTEDQTQIKSFNVCEVPVRVAKFVPRKNWVISGTDHGEVHVFNYNTLEREQVLEAHKDYVRSIAVHPSLPSFLTSSDDLLIKLWEWENWACQQVFEGHAHYVMQVAFNPIDRNLIASASLDGTVKIWQLGSSTANFTLRGHEKGVNCLDFYPDKPYLVSGADDGLIKIWDYENKTCLQTLVGHTNNVIGVAVHPDLPIILTGSEDGTVRVWDANNYNQIKLVRSALYHDLTRVWALSVKKGSKNVVIGYDEGTVMITLGKDEPAISMSNSDIIWAKQAELQHVKLKGLDSVKDGESIPVIAKDMGSCEIYPQLIEHSPNGRFVAVCGNGEYIIYIPSALRMKQFGPAEDFAWSADNEYAILEDSSTVTVFTKLKKRRRFILENEVRGIFGGHLLGIKFVNRCQFCFYDWSELDLIRCVECSPQCVYWSNSGDCVCLATDIAYYILKYNHAEVEKAKENNNDISINGIELAFEQIAEIGEQIKTGIWVNGCFIYTDSNHKLCYDVGGYVTVIKNLDRVFYILGYDAKQDRLYLNDKELNIVSYSLPKSVLSYQSNVMKGDFESADFELPKVPQSYRMILARFLEKQGLIKQALAISNEVEHQFELALALGELSRATEYAEKAELTEGLANSAVLRWTRLGAAAVVLGDTELAKTSYQKAKDFSSLMIFAISRGDKPLLEDTARMAVEVGEDNIAFTSYYILNNFSKCLDLLIRRNRVTEAAFFARSYLPSRVSEVVKMWKDSVNTKVGQLLADPEMYGNLFPELENSLIKIGVEQREQYNIDHSDNKVEHSVKSC